MNLVLDDFRFLFWFLVCLLKGFTCGLQAGEFSMVNYGYHIVGQDSAKTNIILRVKTIVFDVWYTLYGVRLVFQSYAMKKSSYRLGWLLRHLCRQSSRLPEGLAVHMVSNLLYQLLNVQKVSVSYSQIKTLQSLVVCIVIIEEKQVNNLFFSHWLRVNFYLTGIQVCLCDW